MGAVRRTHRLRGRQRSPDEQCELGTQCGGTVVPIIRIWIEGTVDNVYERTRKIGPHGEQRCSSPVRVSLAYFSRAIVRRPGTFR